MEGRHFYPYCLLTMKYRLFITLGLLLFLSVGGAVYAEDNSPQLPVPRFVTLNADEVNLRTGPGIRYPVKMVLKKDGLPVEIIKEFDVWRQIRSKDGDEGWVNKSLLSGKRAIIVIGHIQTLLKERDVAARPVVKLEPGVIAALDRCDREWCYLRVASYKGWLKRENVWGIYADEVFTK